MSGTPDGNLDTPAPLWFHLGVLQKVGPEPQAPAHQNRGDIHKNEPIRNRPKRRYRRDQDPAAPRAICGHGGTGVGPQIRR